MVNVDQLSIFAEKEDKCPDDVGWGRFLALSPSAQLSRFFPFAPNVIQGFAGHSAQPRRFSRSSGCHSDRFLEGASSALNYSRVSLHSSAEIKAMIF